jgi:transposase
MAFTTRTAVGARPLFPPRVALALVKLACQLPDDAERSLTAWTCAELARELKQQKLVEDISTSTVQRILQSHKLKPWRVHHWLTPKAKLDQDFLDRVNVLCDLYSRPQRPDERVLCMDELTSLQPRPRLAHTKPARPGNEPVRFEHEYLRKGALNLIAGFDIHTGKVTAICRKRKRQVEIIEWLSKVERETPERVKVIWVVCDNVRTHKGKKVQAWLAKHPRFRMVHPPVHCSWMNQVEQWFSIIKRKRLKWTDFKDCAELKRKVMQFVKEWNEVAHPFNWSKQSFAKVLAKAEAAVRKAA